MLLPPVNRLIDKVNSQFELHFVDNDIYLASHKTNYSTFTIHLSQTRTG